MNKEEIQTEIAAQKSIVEQLAKDFNCETGPIEYFIKEMGLAVLICAGKGMDLTELTAFIGREKFGKQIAEKLAFYHKKGAKT